MYVYVDVEGAWPVIHSKTSVGGMMVDRKFNGVT